MGRRSLSAAALFVLVFTTHAISPNSTSFDSRWVVQTALSLLQEGNADLNEYPDQLVSNGFYALECVDLQKKRTYPVNSLAECPSGHFYNFYPVGVAMLAAPEVWMLQQVTKHTHGMASGASTQSRKHLLLGELHNAHAAVELLIASSWVALATVLLFLAFARTLSTTQALLLALVFAYGTPAWSTGSRALWMHTASMLMLAVVAWLWTRGQANPRWLVAIGPVLVAAFFLRPTNVVPLGGFMALLAFTNPRRFLESGVVSIPVAAFFVAVNQWMYGEWLAPYSHVRRPNSWGLELHPEFGTALAGNLISPSRGLLIYTPVVLLSLAGLWMWWRRPADRPLALSLAAIFAGHWVLISIYADWFGGDSYGPRYFSDLAPLFVWALVPVMERAWRQHGWAAAFLLLAGISFWMHYRGAWSLDCLLWNTQPGFIRDQQHRLWDWSDPQFWRGLSRPPR